MTKNELKSIMDKNASYYNSFTKKTHIKMILTNSYFYVIHKYMKLELQLEQRFLHMTIVYRF